jgi:Na+-transporting NADH:ubiquinone oxidoreductase subunit NqrD
MPDRIINTDLYQFITKVLIPAFVGISLKLAVQMKRTKLSFLNVSLSFVTGISAAWMFNSLIKLYVPSDYQAVSIAIIAISGEKIGEFLVYKFRVDDFLAAILDAFKQVIIKMINK